MDAIETREHRGFTVALYHDIHGDVESPLDPCHWNDEVLVVFRHRRYDFGAAGGDPFNGDDVTPRRVRAYGRLKGYDVFPVYMLDHSGLAFSIGDLGADPFRHYYMGMDSGLLGFLLLKREAYAGSARTTEQHARALVETLCAWANGSIFGYVVEDSDGEVIDSCWGYVGEADYCFQEGINAADAEADRRDARAALVPHVHRARCVLAGV